jgi:hypothetical protein
MDRHRMGAAMTELSDEEVFGKPGEMSDADVFGAPAPPTASDSMPEAFLDRVRAGQALSRILSAAGHEAKEGMTGQTPTGYSDERLQHMIDIGVFHDPLKSRPGPIQMANEAVLFPVAQAWQGLTTALNAGIHGAGGAVGQLVEEFGGSQGTSNRAKNEVINAGNWAMIEGGMGRFSRPAVELHGVTDQPVGGLPRPEDFTNAAKVLTDGYHGSPHPFTEFDPAKAPYYFTPHADVAAEYATSTYAEGFATFTGRTIVEDGSKQPHIVAAKLNMQNPFTADVWDLTEAAKARDPAWLRANGYDSAILENSKDPSGTEFVVLDRSQIIPRYSQLPAEANLRRMWQEDGIHPAEAVHDAQGDAFLKNEITARQVEVKLDPADEEVLTETGGKPGSLGAAATDPADVPLSVTPARPPGSLAATFQSAADTLLDIGRDAQMLVAPMARGTRDSIAMAKDFANGLRRNRWDWNRIDTDIGKRFTAEQQQRMFMAMDEESTSMRLGEPASMREHQGLATLDPAERALVEELDARQQNSWLRAIDTGVVEGEGIPMHAPRMVMNIAHASNKDGALSLDAIGRNLTVKTRNLRQRKYMTIEETEAAAKAKYGDQAVVAKNIRTVALSTAELDDAIAGRSLINSIKEYGKSTGADTVVEGAIPAGSETKWFTLDHPAFRSWRPQLREIDGKVQAVKDAEGNTIFEQVPLYVHGDFEGPLRAVLSHKSGALYGGVMSLKGKTMSLIMNSPMIHNAVEWGRALPSMPGKVVTFKVYFEGNRAKNNPALMGEAIDNGLVPIGHRFFNQDISGIMESPDLTPGRSWTAKLLAAVPGLFDEAAGVAVKRAVDKAGDFWHNTLLWDRVADLQMGLYTNMQADMLAKGVDRQTASMVAAHWANRYAGALPKEAMSDAATKVANTLMFSRSFTMGNLGVMKDMLTGLPKDVIAQLERNAGFTPGAIDAAGELTGSAAEGVKYAKTMARRKAMAVVLADVALMYVLNSLLQSASNVLRGDNTLDKELHGYAERFSEMLQNVREHPLSLIQPLGLMESLSSTSENEPGKKDRVRVGTQGDGQAIYMRNPVGKIGEEFTGYMTGPLDMMRKKLSTVARPGWQIMSNDAGFGRKVYDPDADTPAKYLKNIGMIAAHLAKSQFPESQFDATVDLVKGEGDAKLNAMKAFGPFVGTTFSKGAPGGPAMGEIYAARRQHDFEVQMQMPDIRRQIQRGDVAGATQRMEDLGIAPSMQRFVVKTTLNPATRFSPKIVRDFYRYASPEQKARVERMQQNAPPPQ